MDKYICTYGNNEIKEFENFSEAQNFADEYFYLGTCIKENDNTIYAPYGECRAKILRLSKEITDYVRDHEFVYGNAPINPAIDHEAKIVSCDRFVSWVLYKLGYTDQPYIQGLCVSGPGLTNWCIDHGFERIDNLCDMLPGDIAFTKKNSIDCPGHTFIFAGKEKNGENFYRYDCGKLSRIRSTQPSCEEITNEEFMYGYRIREYSEYITPSFSFKYDGVPFEEVEKTIERTENTVKYTLYDGIVFKCELKKFKDERVYWWVNRFENNTDHDSKTISELYDCDIEIPFDEDPIPTRKDRQDTWEPKTLRIYETKGANVVEDDYAQSYKRIWEGNEYAASCKEGRSGLSVSPYFDINRNDYGLLMAIGWTGQWHMKVERNKKSVRIRSGIQYATEGFYIRKGESFRTSSTAMLMYYRGQDEAHNRWRSFMRKISPVGKNSNRGEQCPFSAIFWGGVKTKDMLERWKGIFDAKLPFDTCWIDAGWYEPLRSETTATQSAEWPKIGTWEVNTFYHPDKYKSLIDYLHEHNVNFMLWFEPERLNRKICEWTKTLPHFDENAESRLVAMNIDSVCDDVIEMVSKRIEELSISVYRQDLNILPLSLWLHNDEEGRRGMTEILYINNLYRFWDTILERFPNLLIDNCAGGGHRNDIEMLSRSVPLWRSDYQCKWDCLPEANQMQNQAAALWMPYSGIGYGPKIDDLYSFRSAYTNGLTIRTWEHADPEWNVGGSGEDLELAKKYFEEFTSIRHFFSKDYYPLVPFSRENSSWSVSEYLDTSDHQGVILAFRRAASPYDEVTVKMGGVLLYKTYHFENMDTGETFEETGYNLKTKGLRLKLSSPRSSLLLRFK